MSALPPQETPQPQHSSLPPAESAPASPPIAEPGSDDEVPQRSYRHVNNVFTYVIHLTRANSSQAGYVFLIHQDDIPDTKLNDMCQQVRDIIAETRIPRARQELSATVATTQFSGQSHKERVLETRKLMQENPDAINENQFSDDVRFFEACMCDKFNFRVLRFGLADIELESMIVDFGAKKT